MPSSSGGSWPSDICPFLRSRRFRSGWSSPSCFHRSTFCRCTRSRAPRSTPLTFCWRSSLPGSLPPSTTSVWASPRVSRSCSPCCSCFAPYCLSRRASPAGASKTWLPTSGTARSVAVAWRECSPFSSRFLFGMSASTRFPRRPRSAERTRRCTGSGCTWCSRSFSRRCSTSRSYSGRAWRAPGATSSAKTYPPPPRFRLRSSPRHS